MFRTVSDALSVKPRKQTKSAAQRRTIQLGFDIPFLLLVITLIVFGLVMVYSASYDYSLAYYDDAGRIFNRQLLWLALGIAGASVLTFLDYHLIQKVVVPAMLATIIALMLVFSVNEILNGAARTLLKGSVQPSEMAKLVTILYLAVWLYSKRDQLSVVTLGLIPLILILGVVGGLIFLQPDLSAALTIFALGGIMFFLAGGDLKQIGILLIGALLVGWVVVQVHPTGSERVKAYLDGLRDPTQGSYHVRRSLEAFVKGGWFGVGIGKASTKLTGLPVPPTDSIFAVIGEETGFFGALSLVMLYLALLWRGLTIARRAPDDLGRLLAAGLAIWLGLEAFINMAVMVNVMPFAGNALPFISAGGSNLLVSMAAVGILLNISRLSANQDGERGRIFSAVVDLRRRNGRGRVSRSGRSAGTHTGR